MFCVLCLCHCDVFLPLHRHCPTEILISSTNIYRAWPCTESLEPRFAKICPHLTLQVDVRDGRKLYSWVRWDELSASQEPKA